MLVSRTPLRVSFFGGGTDYPEYFERDRGAVIGMAIDQHVYVTAMSLSPIHPYRFRLYWSKIERTQSATEITHPVVRAALEWFGMDATPMGFSIIADLPARNGLGSSSSFTVGFLNLLYHMQSRRPTKADLAEAAVFLERVLLKEVGGVQDQFHAAFGGVNRFDFGKGHVRVTPVQMTGDCRDLLARSLLLLHTGNARTASDQLPEQMTRMREGKIDAHLSHLLALVDQAVDVLERPDPAVMLADLGAMLHEGWETKKQLSPAVTNPGIDALYEAARAAGALGGKLCGAGNGGFLAVLVPPATQAKFRDTMRATPVIAAGLDTVGTTIVME